MLLRAPKTVDSNMKKISSFSNGGAPQYEGGGEKISKSEEWLFLQSGIPLPPIMAMQIPNTRENYCNTELNCITMRVIWVSASCVLRLYSGPTHIAYYDITLYSYLACTSGRKLWNSVVMKEIDHNSNCLVKFMHTEGPSPVFYWSQNNDICWVKSY
jgi:hypothetical protein